MMRRAVIMAKATWARNDINQLYRPPSFESTPFLGYEETMQQEMGENDPLKKKEGRAAWLLMVRPGSKTERIFTSKSAPDSIRTNNNNNQTENRGKIIPEMMIH